MRLLAVLFLIFFSPTLAMAEEPSVSDVVNTLESGYSGLRDLQAGFAQSTTLAGLPKPQKGQGELALRRPTGAVAQFRFDYSTPRQSIISNGKQVWFYQPENRQVLVSPVESLFKGGNSIALAYLTGLGNVSKDFSYSFAREPKDKKGNFQIELTPRNPNPMLSKLRLTISAAAVERYLADKALADTFPILSSVVVDAAGNQTRIEYNRVRVNTGLGAARFNFKIPEGVQVIKP